MVSKYFSIVASVQTANKMAPNAVDITVRATGMVVVLCQAMKRQRAALLGLPQIQHLSSARES